LQERPGYRAVACPVADEIWETGLYLPSSTTLTDAEIAMVCGEIAHAATVAKV
jgi:perosamine synthetase